MLRRAFLQAALAPPPGVGAAVVVVASRLQARAAGVEMPNLARLVLEGVSFTRAYATRPDPAASLSSLRTGAWPHAAAGAARPDLRFEMLDPAAGGGDAPESKELPPNVPYRHEAAARAARAAHNRRCRAIDSELGRLMERLDRDAPLVFTSDCGEMLGAHALEGFDHPHEEACRVPLVIRWPGRIAGGSTSDMLVSHADLVPTLLGWRGEEVPSTVQGRDLGRQIVDGKGDTPDSVYVCGSRWRMVIRGADKMVVDEKGQVTHLYNLAQDPFEQLNRADEPGHKRLRDELHARLRLWMRRTGDRMDPSGLKLRV
jgi:arylsulfatase A-like enzyme